ncbi:MAG: ribonuclease HII [Acidiferrobacterales bacterium]|jgi:ribonuclease HII|nr:ribonuclease HII [Acidiferrobacterales bacterium]
MTALLRDDLAMLEHIYVQSGGQVAGVDEAGRGPLAGPVVAAAVILDVNKPVTGIRDSKKLSAAKREALSAEIKDNALAWSIATASVEEIDSINILQATMLAMTRAVASLSLSPQVVIVDGNKAPAIAYECHTAVKGDNWVPAIGAASILAKVERDRIMLEADKNLPNYGFAAHKGYPTRAHIEALEREGISDIHRKSFAPVRKYALKSKQEYR